VRAFDGYGGAPSLGHARPATGARAARPGPLRAVLYPAAAMSLFAALVHLAVTPEHLSEWWGYGAFFLAAALAQGAYAAALLLRPSRRMLLAGILGNSSIVLLYLATRTLGVPAVGPHAGEVEAIGALDACATVSEVVLVGVLGVLLFWRLLRERVGLVLLVAAIALISLAHLPHLILLLKLL
jgi:hypothetical protein